MITKHLPEGYLPSLLAQAAQRKEMVKHQNKPVQPKEPRNAK